jgi:hypothetical protein
MNIRRRVQRWAKAHNISIDGDLRTSKYYPPEESRSGRAAWWVEVPLSKLDAVTKSDVFCEKGIEIDDFHHLTIPAAYVEANRDKLCTTNEKISLWLSAEEHDLFRDTHRQGSNVEFRRYVVPRPLIS